MGDEKREASANGKAATHQIEWTDEALADIAELRSFLAARNPRAARRVAERILVAVEGLAQFPRSGRIGRVRGTRERIVYGTPYIVAYCIVRRQIRVLSVVHAKRKWPSGFQK